MPTEFDNSELEPEWEWNTRVTAEAARVALATGKTPEERFAIYEQLISAALEQRSRAKHQDAADQPTFNPPKTLYDEVDQAGGNLSGFEGVSPTNSAS